MPVVLAPMACCWCLWLAAAPLVVLVVVLKFRFFQVLQKRGGRGVGDDFRAPARSARYMEVAEAVHAYIEGELKVDCGSPTLSHQESGKMASAIVESGKFLTVDDLIRSKAERLFEIHRKAAGVVEGGLGVRLTVQFNLFGGSVANLGSSTQLEWLRGVMSRGELGCFALTEAKAGVLSGLIVDTTATWNERGFVLHSPEPIEESRKVWISQGLVAKWAVVIARLILPGGVDKGPHAFVLDLESEGVIREDMPAKVDFNPLDNAYLTFDHVQMPLDSILSAISHVDEQGEYHLTDPNVPFNFVVVAQRLLSGRVCIAGASLGYLENVIGGVLEFADERKIPVGRDKSVPLSQLPIMRDNLESTRMIRTVMQEYVTVLENRFMTVDQIGPDLVHQIACGKVECIGFAIDTVQRLKIGVGSLSLFDYGPFGSKNDLLFVFRFAEGDSAVLQQKMVRDAVKKLASPVRMALTAASMASDILADKDGVGCARAMLSLSLLRLALRLQGKKGGAMVDAWLESHQLITHIAILMARLTIFDAVLPAMRNSKELDTFRRHMIAPLVV